MVQYALSFLLTSLVMSVIILAVLVFHALFPRVFPAKLRYAVWMVVLIGLIIPLRPVIGNGLIAVPIPATVHIQPDSSGSFPIAGTAPAIDSAQDMIDTEVANTVPVSRSVSPFIICALVWSAIAAMIFAYHIWRYIRFIRMIRRWGAPVKDEKILSVLRSVQTEKGLSDKKIDLKVCGFVSSSMLTGFLRPVILLPEKHFDGDELELIFRHELIHYKRYDLLVKLLSVIAVSIHWFNPIVYMMCSAMQTDGEASCDEAVLQDAGMENRQFYAEVIIGMIGRKNTSGTLLSTCFYGGKSSIKRRLDSIMDTTLRMKRPTVIVLAAVMALTVLSGSVFAFTQEPLTAEAAYDEPETAALVKLTVEQAKDVALATVGGGAVTGCVSGFENNREVYKVEIIYGDKKYGMEIDAVDSAVKNYRLEAIEVETPPASTDTQEQPDLHAPSDAPAPASTEPTPSESQAQALSTPDPAPASPQETPVAPSSSVSAEITAERAKGIALARIGGGTVTECKLDYENGRKVYEIKIVYGNTKYEMDVDAINGAISDYSAEIIKGSAGHGDHDDDDDDDHDD